MSVGTTDALNYDPGEEISTLKKQVRQLQACLLAVFAIGAIATTVSPGTLRAHRIDITDARGRDRIVLEATGPDGAPHIGLRTAAGVERVLIGDEPDPVVGGKRYPRIAPAWGMLIFNRNGDERGGFSILDNDRSILTLDRANGEGIYMTVNERSGFAGLVGNYETGRVADYAEAFRIGTLGNQAFAQATNRNGSPAGAIVGGTTGPVRKADVVQK